MAMKRRQSAQEPAGTDNKRQKRALQLLSQVPPAADWNACCEELNIHTDEHRVKTSNIILGSTPFTSVSLYPESTRTLTLQEKIYRRAENFNSFLEGFQRDNKFLTHIANFQDVVLVSLCLVLLKNGCPLDQVNSCMPRGKDKKEQKPKTLTKLRHAALGINRIIRTLYIKGWNWHAYDIPLILGATTATYETVWSISCYNTFVEKLSSSECHPPKQEAIQKKNAFYIPQLVSSILGGMISVYTAEEELGYHDHVQPQHVNQPQSEQSNNASISYNANQSSDGMFDFIFSGASPKAISEFVSNVEPGLKAGRLWKEEEESGAQVTSCITALIPKDRNDDITLTVRVGYKEGISIVENLKMSMTITASVDQQ